MSVPCDVSLGPEFLIWVIMMNLFIILIDWHTIQSTPYNDSRSPVVWYSIRFVYLTIVRDLEKGMWYRHNDKGKSNRMWIWTNILYHWWLRRGSNPHGIATDGFCPSSDWSWPWDLNSYTLRYWYLKPARLPIPPRQVFLNISQPAYARGMVLLSLPSFKLSMNDC